MKGNGKYEFALVFGLMALGVMSSIRGNTDQIFGYFAGVLITLFVVINASRAGFIPISFWAKTPAGAPGLISRTIRRILGVKR